MISHRGLCTLVAAALLAVPVCALAQDAATVYGRSCAPCHGKQGRPNAIFEKQGVKNFTDPAWQKATTNAQIEKVIREGKKGTMMAGFEKQLTPEQIKALVAYIRKLAPAKK